MRLTVVAFFVVAFSLSFAYAADINSFKNFDESAESLSLNYVECSAFYELTKFALINSQGDEDTVKQYNKLQNDSMFYALVLAMPGRDKDMAVQVTHSRIEIALKEQKNKIQNRNENFSILINEYKEKCEDRMVNLPDLLLMYIVEMVGQNEQ